jgi:hypothetical protein
VSEKGMSSMILGSVIAQYTPTFKRRMGKHCCIKCMYVSSERESIVLQCAFKLNSVLAMAETWDLKGSALKGIGGFSPD